MKFSKAERRNAKIRGDVADPDLVTPSHDRDDSEQDVSSSAVQGQALSNPQSSRKGQKRKQTHSAKISQDDHQLDDGIIARSRLRTND